MSSRPAFAASLLLLAGCGEAASSGAGALPVIEGSAFFDRPFPADDRVVDGHPDLQGFPHQGEYALMDAYLNVDGELDGFGNNSPIWVRFESPIDPTLLPTPEASLDPNGVFVLLDVTPGSPSRGETVPLEFEWSEAATTWKPGNFLAAAPVFGFPLRRSETYAVLLRSPLVAPGVKEDLWAAPALASTLDTLSGLGVDPDGISYAWTFTTGDPVRETARIAKAIHEEIAHPALGQELSLYADRGEYTAYTGEVLLPVWQHGARPYHDEGGGFEFDDTGAPVIYQWERVQFALTIPKGTAPAGGWPVVLYSHGTGGDDLTFCATGSDDEEGTVMARAGVAMFGVSQPLHADRGTPDTNVDLDSFNFYNPDAGRSNFRQGALDQVYLANLLSTAQATFTFEGRSFQLDPTSVSFFGHSQGGLVGAIAAPFFSNQVRAAGFSGTGGGLSLTLQLRKDPLDIALVLASLLDFDDGEEVTPFHPVIGLIQTLIEVTDPLNYGPYYFAEPGEWGGRPIPILLTEGMDDPYTPPVATEALAAAARIPLVGEPASDPIGLQLRGIPPGDLPTADNATDWDGDAITAGVAQFPGFGHFAIYDSPDARHYYRNFLAGAALDGAPVLDED